MSLLPEFIPSRFVSKKKRILSELSVPATEYIDLSPKGSVDEQIRELIHKINALPGCVTTSSCSGRISVFLEGQKRGHVNRDDLERGPGLNGSLNSLVGQKGGQGGRWLFVSHEPVDFKKSDNGDLCYMLGMKRENIGELPVQATRLVHFKFEPFILHVLTASIGEAERVLSAAEEAGFRESGALSLVGNSQEGAMPMVAVRSMGLGLESFAGYFDENRGEPVCFMPEKQLELLLNISNERFVENRKRIERFRTRLCGDSGASNRKKGQDKEAWEDAEVRRDRKRSEGLKKAEEKRTEAPKSQTELEPNLEDEYTALFWENDSFD